jgi:NAD(P)-dependent dehydrogenase (short-subunit alcohol dehydrogenase family)
MDMGLRDRVVLITGGGGGAGPTIGRAFAAEGAFVAVHHRTGSPSAARAEAAAAGIVAAGGRAIAVGADLGSTAETSAMIERIEAELGAVAVLVTATSGYASGRFAEISDESWDAVVNDALGATFRACRAVVPGMQAAGWGRIVTIAARSGLAGVARSAHYAAAKAAIVGLSASLAKELGPSGILVNAIAPTKILTEKDGVPSIPPDKAAEEAKTIPLRRIATPDDLAALAVWLGSAANTYVTGETISLTGGTQR